MALKKTEPAVRFANYRVSADEMDIVRTYTVFAPSVSATWFGTAASASAVAVGITNVLADYPRNFLFTMLGVAGGMGGTCVVNGKDQFGNTIQETVSFGSAAGGGTVAGTKVFASISSATATPVGLGGTAVGTVSLGVAIGTAVGVAHKFGLPDKLGRAADVKGITWVTTNTPTALLGGTVSTLVDSTYSAFSGTQILASGLDRFVVRYKSSYSAEENVINANY